MTEGDRVMSPDGPGRVHGFQSFVTTFGRRRRYGQVIVELDGGGRRVFAAGDLQVIDESDREEP